VESATGDWRTPDTLGFSPILSVAKHKRPDVRRLSGTRRSLAPQPSCLKPVSHALRPLDRLCLCIRLCSRRIASRWPSGKQPVVSDSSWPGVRVRCPAGKLSFDTRTWPAKGSFQRRSGIHADGQKPSLTAGALPAAQLLPHHPCAAGDREDAHAPGAGAAAAAAAQDAGARASAASRGLSSTCGQTHAAGVCSAL
jgi:hypothetical protein